MRALAGRRTTRAAQMGGLGAVLVVIASMIAMGIAATDTRDVTDYNIMYACLMAGVGMIATGIYMGRTSKVMRVVAVIVASVVTFAPLVDFFVRALA